MSAFVEESDAEILSPSIDVGSKVNHPVVHIPSVKTVEDESDFSLNWKTHRETAIFIRKLNIERIKIERELESAALMGISEQTTILAIRKSEIRRVINLINNNKYELD